MSWIESEPRPPSQRLNMNRNAQWVVTYKKKTIGYLVELLSYGPEILTPSEVI
jgi:hypothetical protein